MYFITRKTNQRWSKINDYLGKVTTTVDSIRYGNLSTKIEKLDLPTYQNVTDSINRMVETLNDREKMIKELLDQKEYKVYDAYKLLSPVDDIDNFIDYLDQLVDLNNPKVLIMVGNKSENYDHLSKYIETVYNKKIYRGIKIVYRGKIYDFSLSERNV